jgi:hypothetical protein
MVGTGHPALWAEGISLPVKMVGGTKATVGAPRELARLFGEPRRVLREDLLMSRGEEDMLCASRCKWRWCSHDLSPRISQPSNKCYGERPVLNGMQYDCGMARPDCSAALHVLPGNRGKMESRRADLRIADLISLRVITQALQGFAQACESRISRRLSLLRLAACYTVLRSRWYQSGIKRV